MSQDRLMMLETSQDSSEASTKDARLKHRLDTSVYSKYTRLKRLEQIELQAKLLDYFLGSNHSNMNQSSLETSVSRDTRETLVSVSLSSLVKRSSSVLRRVSQETRVSRVSQE